MSRKALSLVIAVMISTPALASWNADVYKDTEFSLPYQLYTPDNVKAKLPLIIHLHGTGESGTDNTAQMYEGTHFGPQYFASKENQKYQEAYVLAPQTTKAIRWASTTLDPYDYDRTPSTPSMTALLHLVDKMVNENHKIDPRRIYITGLSRGGQGVWNAMMQRPHLFAAAVPIAGSADPKQAAKIKDIPTWVFHGDSDEVTKVDYSRQMVDAIIRAGGTTATIRYTEIEGGHHEDSWKTAYANSDVYKWLMRHHKHETR